MQASPKLRYSIAEKLIDSPGYRIGDLFDPEMTLFGRFRQGGGELPQAISFLADRNYNRSGVSIPGQSIQRGIAPDMAFQAYCLQKQRVSQGLIVYKPQLF